MNHWVTDRLRKSRYILIIFLLTRLAVKSQMQDPESWKNYEAVFGVKNHQRAYDFSAAIVQSSTATNILWPGEQPHYTVQISNPGTQKINTTARIEIIHFGARGGEDIWLPEIIRLNTIPSGVLDISIVAGGSVKMAVDPVIPVTFGAYAIILDMGPYGRSFLTSVVRTFIPSADKTQFPKQSLDNIGADNLQRLGIHAIRLGIDYVPTGFVEFRQRMEALDKQLKEFQAKGITVLLMFGAGPTLMPLGTPRSFLDSGGVMLNTKQDYVWVPSLDDDFKQFVKLLCMKYGWPNGPVTAVSLWNEPWEGISISGWQSDMLRYREIYLKMADGVMEARKKGVHVLVGGGDSGSNAWDKLFPDGKMTFLPFFDFCSIHYQGMESPAIYPQWINRKLENGRVKIWDTESWVANSDDRIGLVIAANRSAGYDRSMGIYGGYLLTGTDQVVPKVWPQAAALGAAQNLIGERNFKELLFKKGLPWMMVFDGMDKEPDDGTVVVCGDMSQAFGKNNLLFREVRGLKEIAQTEIIRKQLSENRTDISYRDSLLLQLNKFYTLQGASLSMKALPAFQLYDFYGNIIPTLKGMITIPLGSSAFYLRTNGQKGSFQQLIEALLNARIEGYEPVEIIAHDFTQAIDKKPNMLLEMTNILNRPVKGTLSVKIGNLKLSFPSVISFKPFETKHIMVKITSGKPEVSNTYPLKVHFSTDQDGISVHYEEMHVNVISHMTVNIDGNLEDWKNALPQTVSSNGESSVSVTEAAWYPFKNFSKRATGISQGYLAYDKDYFYFACKTADSTPHPGTYRFTERPDDDFFYPDTAWKNNPDMTLQETIDSTENADNNGSALLRPNGDGRTRQFWKSSATTNSFGLYLRLPEEKRTQVSFYLPNLDVWKADIEIFDAQSGNLLASHHTDQLWQGVHEVFNLSGQLKVVFHSNQWWYSVKLAGIFFDSTSGKGHGNEASFVKEDLDTRGNWKMRYGSEGYFICGLKPLFPENVQVGFAHVLIQDTLVWPAGLRHFTYRKDPVLPDNSGLGFSYDNVLIAFNAIPIYQDELLPNPPGTMEKYTGYKCTDYEYALNAVDSKYGGGTEIWRLLVPGMNRKHFFPRQPKSPGEGAVRGGKLVVKRDGNTLITETAIPWSEIPDVKKALDSGKKIKFSFRVNDNGVPNACMELAKSRSVSKQNARAFHPDWKVHWANEVEFGFEK